METLNVLLNFLGCHISSGDFSDDVVKLRMKLVFLSPGMKWFVRQINNAEIRFQMKISY